jgi:hypothetical protein
VPNSYTPRVDTDHIARIAVALRVDVRDAVRKAEMLPGAETDTTL